MGVVFIQFGDFDPDGSEFQPGVVKVARNVLPMRRTWYQLPGFSQGLQLASAYPVLAAYCHLYNRPASRQKLVPDADDQSVSSSWRRAGDIDAASTVKYELLDEIEADTEDYVVSPPAPTAEEYQVRLSPAQEPPDSDHTIYFWYKVFGAPTTFTLKVELYSTSFGLVATKTITGSAATEWTLDSLSLTVPQIQNIATADYADGLFVRFTATTDGDEQSLDPDADIDTGEWEDELGGIAGLHAKLADADDLTYAISQPLPTEGQDVLVISVDPASEPASLDGAAVDLRGYVTNNSIETFRVKLYQGDDEEPIAEGQTLGTGIIQSLGTPVDETITFNLTDNQSRWADIDWDDLRLAIEVDAASTFAATSVYGTSRPGSDVDDNDLFVTALPFWTKLSDEDNGTFIQNDPMDGTNEPQFQVDMGAFDLDVQTDAERRLVITARNQTGQGHKLEVQFRENDEAVETKQFTIATGGTWDEYTWDLAAVTKVTDWENARLLVKWVDDAATGWQIELSEIRLELAAARRVALTKAKVRMPSDEFIAAGWAQMRVPAASSGSYIEEFDDSLVVLGTENRLYTYDDVEGYTDISQGGSAYSNTARAWNFCSWGEYVLAANYADAVQKFKQGDAAASDLITGSSKPKGRFCVVARDQVVLGDINFVDGEADEVWFSKIEDAADFDDESSIRQRLRQTPGQITAMVGGAYLVIFKRTSIYRADFIGAPAYWRFDLITDQVGTDAPRSVVKQGNAIYFKGQGAGQGFYALYDGARVEPIDNKVREHYFDERRAADPDTERYTAVNPLLSESDPRIIENKIVGAYDPSSGIVFWVYRELRDAAYQNTRCALLNTIPGRWADLDLWEDGGIASVVGGISAVCSRPNLENKRGAPLTGIDMFAFNATQITRVGLDSQGVNQGILGSTILQPFPDEDAVANLRRVRLVTDGPYQRARVSPSEARGVGDTGPVTSYKRAYYSDNRRVYIELTVVTADDERLLRNRRSQSFSLQSLRTDEYGWFHVEAKGRFYRFYIKFLGPYARPFLYAELSGLQADFEKGELR